MDFFSKNISPYVSVTQYVSGNFITIALGAFLLFAWSLLEEFRDPILWALIISMALRGVKDSIVNFLEDELRTKYFLNFYFKLLNYYLEQFQ